MASVYPLMQNAELLAIADEAWNTAWTLLNSDDNWKEEKRNEHGDTVMSKKNDQGRKVYRVKALIPVSAAKLSDALARCDKLTDWNDTLTKHEILKKLSDKVVISYQVTAQGGPGGVVSARDFVFIYKTDFKGDAFVQGGCSIDYPQAPSSAKLVRAWNGPGAQVVRPVQSAGPQEMCEFIWLMDCDYRGWIPSSVLAMAMPVAQLQFVHCVRRLAQTIRDN